MDSELFDEIVEDVLQRYEKMMDGGRVNQFVDTTISKNYPLGGLTVGGLTVGGKIQCNRSHLMKMSNGLLNQLLREYNVKGRSKATTKKKKVDMLLSDKTESIERKRGRPKKKAPAKKAPAKKRGRPKKTASKKGGYYFY